MKRKIRQAAVIGAGVMGGGIAALLASAGIRVLLLDIIPLDLKDDEKNSAEAKNRIVKAGFDAMRLARPALLMQPNDAELITLGNLDDDFEKLADCDWIVEAVVENLAVKHRLFERIETIRKPQTIVSSNTSGIPLKSMSKGRSLAFRQYFLGTHFFNPVRYMKLLEIIPDEHTLPELVEFISCFGERYLGKGIVRAKDTPNFIANRIGTQGIVKTMQLMEKDGLTIPEVDALFGPALGRPNTAVFKTADLVGIDILSHVARNTHALVVDDEDRDSFILPEFVENMLANNLLGKKTQGGFYRTEQTPDRGKVRKVIKPDTLEYQTWEEPSLPCLLEAKNAKTLSEKLKAIVYGNDKGAIFAWKAIAGNLIYAANRIPEIADTIIEIDNAMKWGYNMALGPFETWDAIGLKVSAEKMTQDGIPVPQKIKQMIAAGHDAFYKSENGQKSFYDFSSQTYRPVPSNDYTVSLASLKTANRIAKSNKSASLVDLDDGIFCLEFHTKMNTLNREVIHTIYEAVEYVDENGAGLVIGNQAGGMPGAFSAGADLTEVKAAAAAGRFSDIEQMLYDFQYGLLKARYASFPVVAAPYGLTLAGGCEVCLGSDRMIAHCELNMGLVEFGVGLLPAGGGCLALWRNFVDSIPPAVADIDLTRFFIPALMAVATAKVSMSAAEARASGFLRPTDRIVFNRDHLIGEAKKEVLNMVDGQYVPPVKRKMRVVGEAAQGMAGMLIADMRRGNFISEYDEFVLKRIARVMSGGDVRVNSEIMEDVILTLEREAFIDLLKEQKTLDRIDHMLKTGKPLRN